MNVEMRECENVKMKERAWRLMEKTEVFKTSVFCAAKAKSDIS